MLSDFLIVWNLAQKSASVRFEQHLAKIKWTACDLIINKYNVSIFNNITQVQIP